MPLCDLGPSAALERLDGVSNDKAAAETMSFVDGTTAVFQYDRATGEASMGVLEGDTKFEDGQGDVTIVVHSGTNPFQPPPGLRRDSSAQLVLVDPAIDNNDLYALDVRFFVGDRVMVAIEPHGGITRELLKYVCEQIIWELDERAADEDKGLVDLAEDIRWIVVRLLRSRIREVEESVRQALADEHVSAADYEALRDYPTRLAEIERLAISAPEPTWESHRPSSYAFPTVDLFYKSLGEVPTEAKDAVARLSGLISSQQVVVSQRQAAETARFQRLLTLVGTAVLVPGLIAAVFGANVEFRGRDSVQGFWAMLLFMMAGGTGSYALVRSFETRLWSRLARRLKIQDWLAKKSDDDRLVLLVVVTLTAVALGTVLLICA